MYRAWNDNSRNVSNMGHYCSPGTINVGHPRCCKIPTYLWQNKIPVGILGATGIVGQRFVQMLEHHPWFEVAWLAASDRSEGRLYGEAARWRLKTPIPARVAGMRVSAAKPDGAPKLIFAALDAPSRRNLSLCLPMPVAP